MKNLNFKYPTLLSSFHSLAFLGLLTAAANSTALPFWGQYYTPPGKVRVPRGTSGEGSEYPGAHPQLKGLSAIELAHTKINFRKSLKRYRAQRALLEPRPLSILPGDDDNLAGFLESAASPIDKNLEHLEAGGLLKAKLTTDSWSDTYWPIYKGILGQRYADPQFQSYGEGKFKRYYEYVSKRQNRFPDFLANIVEPNHPRLLNLSPSEKYDLLIGDPHSLLTTRMWDDGWGYVDEDGKVETWMGICHGWAPAAYTDPRPLHKISVLAYDQKTQLTFYPSDIKALTSLLWANADSPMLFMGTRCNEKDPPRDANDRLINPDCADMHPGLWHTVVVNKLGMRNQSLIMDAMWDYEVWNQPLLAYSISYFNPADPEKTGATFKTVMKTRAEFASDPNAKFRAPLTKYIVGVNMEVEYLSENSPTHDETDSSENDERVKVTYVYDLELDEAFNIIGGEWLQYAHPDFIWTPPQGSLASTWADRASDSTWSGTGVIPADLRSYAIDTRAYPDEAASAQGLPLAKVVRKLIEAARQ